MLHLTTSNLGCDVLHVATLHYRDSNLVGHGLLLWHRWGSLELVMHGFNHCCKRGHLWVPALDSWSSVLNGDRVKVGMRHGRHHVDLRRDVWELVGQSNLDVKRSRRDRELEWDTVLDILGSLSVQNDVRVHLTQLVHLNVHHSLRLIHHAIVLLRSPLAGQHIVVHF